MRGSASSARAIATRWRWPPRERQPALADERVEPVGQLVEQLVEPGAHARPRRTSSSLASGRA